MRYCPECGIDIDADNFCPKCFKHFEVKVTPTLFPDIIKYRAEIAKLQGYISEIQDNCEHDFAEFSRSKNINEFGGYLSDSVRYKCLKCDKHTSKDYS